MSVIVVVIRIIIIITITTTTNVASSNHRHAGNEDDELHWRSLVRELDQMLAGYELDRALGNPNLTDCSSARPLTKRPDRHKQCLFDIRHIDR